MSAGIQEFDPSVNTLVSLLWQDNTAAKLTQLLELKQAWYQENHVNFWNDWITDVFDLRTANEFGLSVWAVILGFPVTLISPPSVSTKRAFGFGTFNANFNNGNFKATQSTSSYLTLDQKRLILQLRYFKLTGRCTIPAINRMLAYLFGDMGRVYVLDDLQMGFLTYVFTFTPAPALLTILNQFDLLPRPSTLAVKYVITTRSYFGFGTFNKNFGNGTFAE